MEHYRKRRPKLEINWLASPLYFNQPYMRAALCNNGAPPSLRFSGRLRFAINLLSLCRPFNYTRRNTVRPDAINPSDRVTNFLSPPIRYSDLAAVTVTISGELSLAPTTFRFFVLRVYKCRAQRRRRRRTKPSLFRESGQVDAILLHRACKAPIRGDTTK